MGGVFGCMDGLVRAKIACISFHMLVSFLWVMIAHSKPAISLVSTLRNKDDFIKKL